MRREGYYQTVLGDGGAHRITKLGGCNKSWNHWSVRGVIEEYTEGPLEMMYVQLDEEIQYGV